MYYDERDFDTNETPEERWKKELGIVAILAAAMATIGFVAMWTHGYLDPLKAFVNLYIPLAGF